MPERLDTLPTEIIHTILVYATDASPRTGRSLSLTNKCLHEAIKVIRSRRRTIKFDKDRRTYEPANFDSSAFTNTNYLTIEASELSDPHLFNQTFVVQLLENIQNLKTLTWNVGPISIDVLSALGRLHPRCILRIFAWWRLDGNLNHLDETEIALTKFKNLTHFRYVTVSDPSSAATLPEAYSWEPFQEIVANSHNLVLASFLSSSIYRDAEAPDWVGKATNNTKAKTKRNALKSLTIDCPNLTLSSSTLQEIDKFTDLSALEYLKFSRGRAQDYFQVAATLLPNLKHISLNFINPSDESLLKAAGEYLRNCSPVQTLSLWGWSSVISLPDLITRHGPSLQVLQLHEKDSLYNGPRRVLGLSDVKLLMDSCPGLTDVTVDLDINAEYTVRPDEPGELVEILGLLAMNSRLRRVQIYLSAYPLRDVLFKIATEDADTETTVTAEGHRISTFPVDHPFMQSGRRGRTGMIAWRSKYILPIVEPCATAIWDILYGRSTSGERLLDLKFGDWETRSPLAPPAGEPRTFCQVRPHERDDRIGRCFIRTKHWSRYVAKGVEI